MRGVRRCDLRGRNRYFACTLLLFWAVLLSGRAATNLVSQYHSRLWQAEDGLSHNWIQAVCQDRQGYLWVGTRDGLIRFDGVRFVPVMAPELKGHLVSAVREGADGSLWIGVEDGALTRYKDGKFFRYDHANGLPGDNVRALCRGRDGSIWIATLNGACRFQDGKFSPVTMQEGLASNFIRDICEGPDGSIWIATDRGLNRWKDGVITRVGPTAGWSYILRSVFADLQGTLWVGTMVGLFRIQGDEIRNYTKADGLPDNLVLSIRSDQKGTLWFGTSAGLGRLVGDQIVTVRNNEGESFDQVYDVMEDREGNLWVGAKDGLHRLNPRQFSAVTHQKGLSHNNVMSVLEDRTGAVWMATWGGGLNRMADGKFTTYNIPAFVSDLVLSLHEAHDGSLWIGMEYTDGIYRFKDGQFTHFAYNEGLIDSAVMVIYEDSHTNLWVGTRTALDRMKDGKFTRYTKENGLAANSVRSVMEDHAGVLWFGTSEGLSRWENDTFTSFRVSDGLPHTNIVSVYEDAAHVLWVGTRGGGICRMQPRREHAEASASDAPSTALASSWRFTACTSRSGLFDDNIFEIVEDDLGFFWISSLKGIFRVSKRELEEFCDGKKERVTCMAYGKADGVVSTQCNGVAKPCAWKTKDGRIWFATTKGAVMTDPALAVGINEVPPPVLIERVVADKKQFDVTNTFVGTKDSPARERDPLRFGPGRGEIEFQYTALSYRSPERVRFKYKLDGVDQEWVEAGTRRTAHYNNIYPGQYLFRVIACNNDGIWNDTGASFAVILLPHFWETRWFLALGLVVVLGTITAFVRFISVKKLQTKLAVLEKGRAVAEERSRIAQDMHDNLGARLTQILVLSDLARNSKGRPDDMETHVGRIASAVQDVTRSLDGIVWAVNPENDSLERMVGYIHEFAAIFLETASINCHLDSPREMPNITLSSEVRHHLFLVIKESLNNIVKHSGASEVRIVFHLDALRLSISIEDNGKGFAIETASAFGNGLRNMQKRMEKVRGSFAITSEAGKGTKIAIRLDLERP